MKREIKELQAALDAERARRIAAEKKLERIREVFRDLLADDFKFNDDVD